jgi:hypothetical protein
VHTSAHKIENVNSEREEGDEYSFERKLNETPVKTSQLFDQSNPINKSEDRQKEIDHVQVEDGNQEVHNAPSVQNSECLKLFR